MAAFRKSPPGRGKSSFGGNKKSGKKPFRSGDRKKTGGGDKPFRARSTEGRPARPFAKREGSDDRRKSGSDERPFRPRSSEGRPARPYAKREGSDDRKRSGSDERPFRPRSSEGRPARPYAKREGSDDRRKSGGEERPFRPRSSEGRPARPYAKREGTDKFKSRPFDKSSSDRPFRPRKEDDRPFSRAPRGASDESADRRPSRPVPDERVKRPYKRREEGETGERKSFEGTGEERERNFSDERPKRPRRSDGAGPPLKRREASGQTELPFDQAGEERPYKRREEGESAERKPFDKTGERPERKYTDRRRDDRPAGDRVAKGWGKPRPGADAEEPKKWNRKEDHTFYGDKKKPKPFGKKASGPRVTAADEGLTRLNKFIANAGICSRREADEMIQAGVISVNGEIITEMGYKVKPGDVVKYNNAILRGERLVYILINKPKDFITTTDDPEERKTVMNLIENACKERVYPVGRLDRNTTGVILMTNDGDLARKLTHPSFQVQKVYQVELDSGLKSSDFQKIAEGITLDDGFIKVDDIAYVGTGNEKSVLGVEVHSGRNRIVRRIFENFGYRVKKLDRVIFAGLTKKDLPRGRWRFLTPMEVANLKMMTGSKKFASLEDE